MSYLLKTTLIGLFFGTFGTTLGGIIGVSFKRTSNKFWGITPNALYKDLLTNPELKQKIEISKKIEELSNVDVLKDL